MKRSSLIPLILIFVTIVAVTNGQSDPSANNTFTIKINIDNILKEFLEKNSITTARITVPTSVVTTPSPDGRNAVTNIDFITFPADGSSTLNGSASSQSAVTSGNGSSLTGGIGGVSGGGAVNGTTLAVDNNGSAIPVSGAVSPVSGSTVTATTTARGRIGDQLGLGNPTIARATHGKRYSRTEGMLIAILVLFSFILLILIIYGAYVFTNGCGFGAKSTNAT